MPHASFQTAWEEFGRRAKIELPKNLAIAFAGPQEAAVLAAGILLYRAFTFGMEIPVGGLWLVGWLFVQRSSRRSAVSSAPIALGEAA